MDFTVAELHAGRPNRGEDERQAGFLADDGGGKVARRNVDQNSLSEFDLPQVLAVGAQRLLGIGASIGVVEKCLWHLSHMDLAQIFYAGDMLHIVPPGVLVFTASLFI